MTAALDRSVPIRTLLAFAVGALLAAAVTAMVLRSESVTAEGDAVSSSYTAITPCRLADTRPSPDRVGSKATFSTEDTHTFDLSAGGDSGECDPIGDDVTAVAMNITALNATELSFLTVWPAGDLPLAASLNPAPGQPPVPNAVTTQLDGTSFNVYNDKGSVDLVIDVVGVYTASAGPSDFMVVSQSFPLSFTAIGSTSGNAVDCPDGMKATGGGTSVIVTSVGKSIGVAASIPSSNLSSWSGRAIANSSGLTLGTMNVYAVCAKNVVLAPT